MVGIGIAAIAVVGGLTVLQTIQEPAAPTAQPAPEPPALGPEPEPPTALTKRDNGGECNRLVSRLFNPNISNEEFDQIEAELSANNCGS